MTFYFVVKNQEYAPQEHKYQHEVRRNQEKTQITAEQTDDITAPE